MNEILLKSLDIIHKSKLWEDKLPSEILKILLYVHSKGWLYTPVEDGKIKAVICAYRIKEGDSLKKLPVAEDGNTLYVPFAISMTDENIFRIIRESLDQYLLQNPEVTEMVMEDKNNQIKRFKLGAKDGEESAIRTPSTADISN